MPDVAYARSGDVAIAYQVISAAAQAGEVLVSGTVKDLVAGSGMAFEDRGEHELKGFQGAWRLHAVVSVDSSR